ncbi:MAG TPA: OmpP1/FadL family transporter [Thiobacillaceae bacterium]|nr:OmpP1/FadL family transporter [Thiobacillaceae bacterium]HNU65177.1 OmpP1/FadL family transporter [Thiobacillaceae bacterium]
MHIQRFALGLAGLLVMASARGSGFALIEQNASGLGNAYAGAAAVAEDASTLFFNPAGLSQVEGRQVVVAGHAIVPSAKFSGTSSTALPVILPTGSGGDAGKTVFVPNIYYAMDLRPDLKFGIGLNAPFGLTTEYGTPWAGQAQAVKSELKTYNLNPSLAWKASERLSLGAGLNWQRIEAELSSVHPLAGIPVVMKGTDKGSWGWNLGGMWDLDGFSRLGLAYRASIEHRLRGRVTAAVVTPVYADVELPATASLSYWRRMNPTWDVLADVTWTEWSDFQSLDILPQAGGPAVSSVPELWRDTWRYSVGLNYRPNRAWTWRVGLAYDESPVPDAAHRTARIPDNDRTWLAMGGQYRLSPASAVDFGYAHIFFKDGRTTHGTNGVLLNGAYTDRIDILSAQYTHSF